MRQYAVGDKYYGRHRDIVSLLFVMYYTQDRAQNVHYR